MFTIRSLKLGELYIPHEGALIRDPVYCWLVSNGAVNILVDSGMTDVAEIRRSLHVDGVGGGHAALTTALAGEGLKPGDISLIVTTHLHYDHAANLDLFPHAQIVLQRDELLHAVDPVPTQRIFYQRAILTELMGRKRPSALRLVDGDMALMEGLTLLNVPAHTPGMQVPIVTTTAGRAALVTDLGDHYVNWFPADPRATNHPTRYLAGDFLPGSIRSESERDWHAAMRRVLDHADIVVPAHDFRIPKRMPEEWFAIPDSTEGDLSHDWPADRGAA
jgi:N-acyl homoserine lactone hydrolase